ncbi:hypothetical protein BU23DRAFT_566219 [Bimuria novae-zelandiae CBS 107.79]|uniref:Uncharacterized protein n=1 Tax=Bimuria novae-zelandiae CBS 107.79 TaxID=1447943 RepID=A0A6A5VH43_9PLEO|nr:hypothetical protein BU23DRAFT_566219 [Bimuria novae-zelandiae CBS 107.79]
MHMSFNLSKLAKPPSSHCLRQLGDSIVDAPAWKQFGLRLSFPLNYQPTQENLRINVDHCREKDQSPTTANHSSIANSDVRPPEGIPQIFLESVEFVIATFDTRSRSAARKRPKRESTQQKAGASQPDASVNDVTSLPGKAYGSNQCLKFSDLGWADADQEGNDVHETRDTARRSLTSPNFDTNSGWPQAFTYHSKRKQPVTESELHVVHVSDHTSESAQLAGLVDAVLRLSICLNLRGSISNLRVKANTFLYGLTNIAPALWRIGYLITCSPAMYTNPTLGRSLGRINIAARSTDLKAKIRALGSGPSNVRREQGVAGYDCVRHMASAITDRLWIHIQRSQLSKPMSGSIQSMCDPEFEGSSTEDPAELLEEHTSTNRSGCQDSNAGLETPVLPPREQLRGPLYSENLDTEPRLSQLHPAVYYLGSDIMETSCTRYNNRKPDAIPDTFDMVTLMHQSSESQHRSSSASSSSLGSPLSADHISHDSIRPHNAGPGPVVFP